MLNNLQSIPTQSRENAMSACGFQWLGEKVPYQNVLRKKFRTLMQKQLQQGGRQKLLSNFFPLMGYPPPTLTENHPAKKPLRKWGYPPPYYLAEKIRSVVFDDLPFNCFAAKHIKDVTKPLWLTLTRSGLLSCSLYCSFSCSLWLSLALSSQLPQPTCS